MSKEAAAKFLEKLEIDAEFKKRLQHAKNSEERKKIQEEENFLFTKEEFFEAYKEKYHKSLSDEELKKLAAAGPSSASPLETVIMYFSE